MRPLSGIAFALAIAASSSVGAQTAPSQSAPPQTARQALIEMFFGQAPGHLEKHLSDATRQTYEKLGGANGQSAPGVFSMLAAQSKGGMKMETFDTGSTFLTAKEPAGGNYERMYITVERDDLVGDEDQIELALHMISGGKEETLLPFILRFNFLMKMESEVWRLNEVRATVRFPLADPAFLKGLEERQFRQNEQTALWSVRAVAAAEKSYQTAQGGFACTLSTLGSTGKEAGATKRGYLYDSQLAGGKKNGYTFAISECDTSHYRVVAEPEAPGSGQRAFCSDESGTVRASADGKAATCMVSGEVVEEKVATPLPRGSAATPRNPASGTPQLAGRIRISQGVATGLLVSKVPPIYPPLARDARIQGSVVMKAVISQTGDVISLELVSGHPMLAPAALDAVRQWKYRPYLLNGNAVEAETQVTVSFTLSEH
ncbi:MAG: energy transducer TonB [Terriglobales bacterium]|jgi:TonB family protein